MIKARIISIEFTPSEYALTNGHKMGARDHYRGDGAYVRYRGYGWASECKPSKITLKVKLEDGSFADVWVDRYFKENWGRLTAGRVRAIFSTVPSIMLVEANISRNGNIYYTAVDECMHMWLESAMVAR